MKSSLRAKDALKTPQPPWIHLARGFWSLIFLLILLLFVIGLPARLHELNDMAGGAGFAMTLLNYRIPVTAIQWLAEAISGLGFLFVGLLIFWRKSNEWMAILTSIFLITLGPSGGIFGGPLQSLPTVYRASFWPVALLRALGWACFLPFFLLFPNGRLVPDRKWIRIILVIWVPITIPWNFLPEHPLSPPNWPPLLFLAYIAFMWGVAIFAQIYRYRNVSGATERQQAKWLVFGFAILAAAALSLIVISILPDTPGRLVLAEGDRFLAIVSSTVSSLLLLVIPISIAVAILRYRLWDIDLLIRRTLSYAIVTGVLAMIYFAVVVVLQNLFLRVVGQRSPIVVVISTLAIAALFNPLRRRSQAFIDRRFYRRQYDAAQTLAQFAQTARDETDLDALTAELLRVVQETMQPDTLLIWMKTPLRNELRNDEETVI